MRTALQQMVGWLDAAVMALQWNGYYNTKSHAEAQASAEEFRQDIRKGILDFLRELCEKCKSLEFKKELEQAIQEVKEWPVPGTEAGKAYSRRKFGDARKLLLLNDGTVQVLDDKKEKA